MGEFTNLMGEFAELGSNKTDIWGESKRKVIILFQPKIGLFIEDNSDLDFHTKPDIRSNPVSDIIVEKKIHENRKPAKTQALAENCYTSALGVKLSRLTVMSTERNIV